MARQRKTMDQWEIQQCVGGEWETVCTDLSAHRARVTVKEYRENQPEYPVQIKMTTFKRADHDASQLARFDAEAKAGRLEGYEHRRKLREARRKREAALSS